VNRMIYGLFYFFSYKIESIKTNVFDTYSVT